MFALCKAMPAHGLLQRAFCVWWEGDNMVTLKPAGLEDAETLLAVQKQAFNALLEKYQDYDTNPAMEPLATLKRKLSERDYYLILLDGRKVGYIGVRRGEDSLVITPIGLLPECQGKGVGHKAMLLLEELYPENRRWSLGTILQEPGLCRFYESLGYRRTGEVTNIRPGMDEVGYEKVIEIEKG